MNELNLPFVVDFSNKVIVITGAGGIICSHLAKALALCKGKIALLDLNLENAEKYAEEIRKLGGEAYAYEANVLNKDSLISCHEKILKDLGSCDILINGAGGNNSRATTDNEYLEIDDLEKNIKTFFDLDSDGIQFVFNLNFLGTLLPTQIFSQDMIGKDGCSILNISSMNAYTPLTKIPAYSGAKAAVSNFTQWLAVHFSHLGIRVNAIAPGFFSTTQNKSLLWNPDGTPTERTKKILQATPMRRFGEIDELVGATLFLLNEKASSFITGICLPIDGGFSSYSGV